MGASVYMNINTEQHHPASVENHWTRWNAVDNFWTLVDWSRVNLITWRLELLKQETVSVATGNLCNTYWAVT